MKKQRNVWISLGLLIVCMACLLSVWLVACSSVLDVIDASQMIDSPGAIMPRRTVITVGGDVLREIVAQNVTSVAGVVTIEVDTLENPTDLGTLSLADNAGVFEVDGVAIPVDGYSNTSSFNIWKDGSGTPELQMGNTPVIQWDTSAEELKWWDGTQWRNFGSGSGQGFALTVDDHTNTALSNTKSGQYTQFDETTLQMSFLANVTDLATAENFLHRIETQYSCTMQKFGKDASNHLFYEHGTTVAAVCVTTTYTSTATLSTAHQSRWVEYAVQVDESGDVVFYVDGEYFDNVTMTDSLTTQATHDETLRLYEGFRGGMGPAKIGNLITWPTTGWKGIDLEMQTFPGVVFALPLTEYGQSTVADVIGSESLAKDGDVSWTEVDGGF